MINTFLPPIYPDKKKPIRKILPGNIQVPKKGLNFGGEGGDGGGNGGDGHGGDGGDGDGGHGGINTGEHT